MREWLPKITPAPANLSGLDWVTKRRIDLPEPAHLARYEAECAEYIDALCAVLPTIEVFDFGEVGTPGVSDIDLLCVVPDATGATLFRRLALVKRPPLCVHDPIMVPASGRADLRWLLPISNFRRLAGPPEAQPMPPELAPDVQVELALIDAFNSALIGWKSLGIARADDALRVRRAMLTIWSARASVLCAARAGLALPPRWQAFIEDAAAHRAIWRGQARIDIDMLVRLLDEASAVLQQIVEATAAAITLRIDPPAPVSLIRSGRVLFRVAADAEAWQTQAFDLARNRRRRRYFRFELPYAIVALMCWRPVGGTTLDACARRRATILRRRALLTGSPAIPEQVLTARLLEKADGSLVKRLTDALVLTLLARTQQRKERWQIRLDPPPAQSYEKIKLFEDWRFFTMIVSHRKPVIAIAVVLAACILLLNASWLAPHPPGGGVLLAHRGIHQRYSREGLERDTCTASRILPPTNPYLENTIASMRASFARGAEMLEIDIHPTTDGQFAVFHDWTLNCRTNGRGVTREQTMAYLKSLDIGWGYTADGGRSYPFRGKGVGQIPALTEVLGAFPDRRFLLNFKSRDSREADRLLAYLSANHIDIAKQIMVYGDVRPVGRWRQIVPEAQGFTKSGIKVCTIGYALGGWAGYVPAACANGAIAVPVAWRGLYWGWPNRLLQRMRNARAEVILIGTPESANGIPGLNDAVDLDGVPDGFDGIIWADAVEEIGPAWQAKRAAATQQSAARPL
jgi:glycerophosphoryl diester phosphodiesterase